jgi:Fe2+ transport system protein FeoA
VEERKRDRDEIFKIKGFSDPAMAARFLELGILPGDTIKEVGKAPFNGALRVETQKGVFGLRKAELEAIIFDSEADIFTAINDAS